MEKTPPLTPAAWLRFDAIFRAFARVPHRRVLEVGAGEGALAWRLARLCEYVGVEPDTTSFDVASRRLATLERGRIYCGTVRDLPTHAVGVFDLICAFEVLEHVEDDQQELLQWQEFLEPAGGLLISVPAHRRRFAAADRMVGHYRRYDRADLEHVLIKTGFEILSIESWGAGLGHLLEAVRNVLAKSAHQLPVNAASARSGRWMQPKGRAAGLAAAAIASPFRLVQAPFRNSDCGIGWVALGRKGGPTSE